MPAQWRYAICTLRDTECNDIPYTHILSIFHEILCFKLGHSPTRDLYWGSVQHIHTYYTHIYTHIHTYTLMHTYTHANREDDMGFQQIGVVMTFVQEYSEGSYLAH